MKHVVYYEPDYDTSQPNLWQLRGHYKYPSILGNLCSTARITMLMHRVPPADDPHRRTLEREHGVEFRVLRHENTPGARRAERLAIGLRETLARLQPDIVSNLNGRSVVYCFASALAAAALGCRYVMRVGGDDLTTKAHVYTKRGQAFLGTKLYVELMRQERLAVDMADGIIAMTRREKARLAAIARDANKIAVCYRGVDPRVFFVDAPRQGPCRRFLFIGRKSAEKGYDLLEEAARRLHAEGCDVEFTFAGTFKPKAVENRRYVGYVKYADLPALYAAHDALIMCSRTEGFPQVIMEAMGMGLPCIMSRHLFDLDFEEGETALFCDSEAGHVADRIRRLRDDAALYRHLSMHSLTYAHAEFSQDALRERYQRVLLGL